MCKECGCGVPERHAVHAAAAGHMLSERRTTAEVAAMVKGLLAANDREAAHNREHFDQHGVLTINLMSSPGAGKTSLLEATIDAIGHDVKMAVIEGDLETENDAARIRARGVAAVQVTTGATCHLDAVMVHDALHHLVLRGIDLVFIENVGNLVCPASFDLGQHLNVTLLSVTEGDDKPAKYPVMFRASDLVLLTKLDLLPHLDDFNPQRAAAALMAIGHNRPMIEVSARAPGGAGIWIQWLKSEIAAHRKILSTPGSPQVPRHHRHGAVEDHTRQVTLARLNPL
jgi:hydrogenase nickel incorporation protein HypB